MNDITLIEEMLKKYSSNNLRIIFFEKQKKIISENSKNLTPDSNSFAYEKSNFDNTQDMEVLESLAHEFSYKVKDLEKELAILKYLNNTIDNCLDMLKTIDERYSFILEKHYIHNVRMELISEMMHISRSRCYDLCKKGIFNLSDIIFGRKKLDVS